MPSQVLAPTSAEEAIASFGDGGDLTVLGGGTILMPELAARDLGDVRVLSLQHAGMDGVSRAGGRVTIGASTPVAAVEALDEPLATAARHIADPEIRAQATLGGNVCARAGHEAPRGDLQAPLLALDATVASAVSGSRDEQPIEGFLAGIGPRLVLEVSYPDVGRAVGYAVATRPHAHHYTILAACAVRDDSATRVAVTGAAPTGRRCPSVEAAVAAGKGSGESAAAVLDDVGETVADDALASAWYRRQVLPVIVKRALTQLEEASA